MDLTKVVEADASHFDDALEEITTQDLVRLVEMLQSCMMEENKHFAELSERLRVAQNEANAHKLEELSTQLCLSQSRLAQLCAKNMKCFNKQTAAVPALQSISRDTFDEASVQKPQRKSLSALHREKKQDSNHQGAQGANWNGSAAAANGHSSIVNSPKSPAGDASLRNAFQAVLGDILGQEYQLKAGGQDQSITSPSEGKAAGNEKQLFSDHFKSSLLPAAAAAADESVSVHKTTTGQRSPSNSILSSSPKSAALDRDSLSNSKHKILEQIRRARKDGSSSSPPTSPSEKHSSATEFQPRSPSASVSVVVSPTASKPVRSILKKRSTSDTTEPAAAGNGTSLIMSSESGYKSPFTNSEQSAVNRSAVPAQIVIEQTEEFRKTTTDGSKVYEKHTTVITEQTGSSFGGGGGSFELPKESATTVTSAKFTLNSHSSDHVSKPQTTTTTEYRPPPPLVSSPPRQTYDSKSTEKPASDFVYSAKPIKSSVIDHEEPSYHNKKDATNGHGMPTIPHALRRVGVEVSDNGDERLRIEENAVCRDWDPTALLNELYKIEYSGRREDKRSRFVNMEGHMEHLPLGVKSALAETAWKSHYFKTKDGRLLWFQTPYADEFPLGDVLLSGADVDVNKEECTLAVHGGRDGSHLSLRSTPQVLDKWRQALLSHAASSIADSYVCPVRGAAPSPTDNVVIIELGSCSIRAGLLTEQPTLPQAFFPSVANVLPDGEIVVGIEALHPKFRHEGTIVQPIRPTQAAVNRYTMDLNIVKHMLREVFVQLKIQAHSYKVLLSVPQNAPAPLIADLLRILLDEFKVRGAAVARQPFLVLYAYDVTTGVVVDIGDRMNIVPVIDGFLVQNAIVSLPYGSAQISESLRDKLSEQNVGLYAFISSVEKYILRYIMEQACYVAPEFDAEVAKYDGLNSNEHDRVVSVEKFDPTEEMQKDFRVDSARFTSTEGLLKPKGWGLDISGLHKLIFNAIQSSPMDSRRTLYRNIYLAGGCTLLPGLAERLENELSQLVASSIHIQVHISPWRYHAAFLGAQVLAASTQFDQMIVTSANLDQFLRKMYASNF